MQRDPRAFLWDVRESALAIQAFTNNMNAADYEQNAMAQAAVERKFEIIGEALNQLSKTDASLAAKIPDLAQIVAFRNQLIHGYATVNAASRATKIAISAKTKMPRSNDKLLPLGSHYFFKISKACSKRLLQGL
jgi:uncharacterized protein with HEPN domain